MGQSLGRFFATLGSNKHTALITNAADQFPEEGIIERLSQDREFLAAHDITSERLDLRTYFGNNKKLAHDIKKFGSIWVRGANVFVLRRAFAQSGLDEILPKLLAQDLVAYGGYSAGACIMGSTLTGLELVDDAYVAPEGYKKEVLWDGLKILPYAIAPHYKSNHPESELIDKSIEYFEEHKISYKALHDGEAIFIHGDVETLVS